MNYFYIPNIVICLLHSEYNEECYDLTILTDVFYKYISEEISIRVVGEGNFFLTWDAKYLISNTSLLMFLD